MRLYDNPVSSNALKVRFLLAELGLAAREGAEDLYPSDPRERAPVEEFLDRYAMILRPALFKVEFAALGSTHGVGFVPEKGDPEAAARAAEEIAETLALFARAEPVM